MRALALVPLVLIPSLIGQVADRMRQVETGFSIPLGEGVPPLEYDIRQLMEVFQDPGLSVAVIDDYKIAWSKGYGVTEVGGSRPVNAKTLFQAGSISKAVSATAALSLVEQGKLSLDEDVNKKLVTWRVPENDFTSDQKVTLRRLLSHSAGLTIHGFPGYEAGEAVPSLVQVFNGQSPANTEPIRVDFVPGSNYRYSGGGFTIAQQLMIDVTGKSFQRILQETVLDKIGMKESTFEQPLPSSLAPLAATGTMYGRVLPGRWHTYPEMAAAGLWTTSSDLARFAIEIALSKQGKSNRVLSEKMTREALTPQGLKTARRGLGFVLGSERDPDFFGHDGSDRGFQAILVMLGDSGQGAAIMTNSDQGLRLAPVLLESIAKAYRWKVDPWKISGADVLVLVAALRGMDAALQEYAYLKKAAVPDYNVNANTLLQFGNDLLASNKTADAVRALELNAEENPANWRSFDSLAEAHARSGDRELAIQSYRKSLDLNPKNQNAVEALRKLNESAN